MITFERTPTAICLLDQDGELIAECQPGERAFPIVSAAAEQFERLDLACFTVRMGCGDKAIIPSQRARQLFAQAVRAIYDERCR